MIYSANLAAILIPVVLLQYGFALFCLVKLVFLDLPKKKFFLWNFFILLVVGVGIITFLVCYFGFRDKVFPKQPEPPAETENGSDSAAAPSEKNAETPAESIDGNFEKPVEPDSSPAPEQNSDSISSRQ